MTPHHDLLIQHLEKYTRVSEEEKQLLRDHIEIREFKKGTLLLEPGQVSRECYFCLQGCVRHYYLVEGEEKTTDFYTEEQAIVSFTSFSQGIPADHYWECMEDCVLTVGTAESEADMLKRFPRLEGIMRVMIEESFGKQQTRLASNLNFSPEQRYLEMLRTRPELSNRVPQYQLASYIGVTPESLSRIRRRILLKN